jgi:hypothetical protein
MERTTRAELDIVPGSPTVTVKWRKHRVRITPTDYKYPRDCE